MVARRHHAGAPVRLVAMPAPATAPAAQPAGDAFVLINAALDAPPAEPVPGSPQRPALIADSRLPCLNWQGRSVVAGLLSEREVTLGADLVLHQLPVTNGFVTRLFGLDDDPKRLWSDDKATFLNRPFGDWLAELGESPEVLWPHVPQDQRNLWHARLYPVTGDRDASLELALPLQAPAAASAAWRSRWKTAERLSLAEGFTHAAARASSTTSPRSKTLSRGCRVRGYTPGTPRRGSRPRPDHRDPAALARRCRLVEKRLEEGPQSLPWRGLAALAAATGDAAYEDRAFANLAQAIEADVNRRLGRASAALQPVEAAHEAVPWPRRPASTSAAAGLTPRPTASARGIVLNAAVTLRGPSPHRRRGVLARGVGADPRQPRHRRDPAPRSRWRSPRLPQPRRPVRPGQGRARAQGRCPRRHRSRRAALHPACRASRRHAARHPDRHPRGRPGHQLDHGRRRADRAGWLLGQADLAASPTQKRSLIKSSVWSR